MTLFRVVQPIYAIRGMYGRTPWHVWPYTVRVHGISRVVPVRPFRSRNSVGNPCAKTSPYACFRRQKVSSNIITIMLHNFTIKRCHLPGLWPATWCIMRESCVSHAAATSTLQESHKPCTYSRKATLGQPQQVPVGTTTPKTPNVAHQLWFR